MSLPPPTNVLTVAAYIIAVIVSLPVLFAVAKVTTFVNRATAILEQVEPLAKDFQRYRHEKAQLASVHEITLTLMEQDINSLQEHTELPVRRYPDRRIGSPDRRSA